MSPSEELVQKLAALGAEIAHVNVDDVLGRSRYLRPSTVRQALMCVLSDCGWSLVSIGYHLGRDHSTIAHGVTRARRLRRVDSDFEYLVTRMRTAADPQHQTTPEDQIVAQVNAITAAIERADTERRALLALLDMLRRPVVIRGAA